MSSATEQYSDAVISTRDLLTLAEEAGQLGIFQWFVPEQTVHLSQKCLSIYGLTEFDGKYETWMRSLYREDVIRINDLIDTTVSSAARNLQAEYRIIRPNDGALRWIATRSVIFYDEGLKPKRVVGINIDVTDQKRAAAELRALTDTLEERVKERTEDLKAANEARRKVEDSLRQAQRMAEVGQIAATIAHEIDQPLGAIVTSASAGVQWLSHPIPDLDEARASLKRISEAGLRAGAVIAGIRSMVKRDDRAKTPYNINELVREVLMLVGGEVESHQVSVRVEFSPELPKVLIDRIQLQQVILNLVKNAIEAMSSPEIAARVLYLRSETVAPTSVMVTVRDTGTGIDDNNIEHVFDAFFTTKSDGMGLGLAVCKSIVEAHNGRLMVARDQTQGSVFRIVLPIHQPGIS